MLIGYDHILSSSVFSKDLPHACLFEGIEGIGKSLLCKTLAKKFGRESDIYELSSGKVEDVRAFVDSLCYRSFSGIKIAIIDGDLLSKVSAQVLLKILEEPPSWVRFLIYTSKSLPLTIKSRCLCYSLPPLPIQVVSSVLKFKSMAADMADNFAALSGGSVAVAYRLIETLPKYERVKTFIRAVCLDQMSTVIRYLNDWDMELDGLLKEFVGVLCSASVSCNPFDIKDLENIIKKSKESDLDSLLKLWSKPMKPSLRAMVFALKLRKILK